jgi:pseudouridylate synthase I
MARFKLTVEYDGTKFRGWQYQPNQPTIMGRIMEACSIVFNTNKFELYGAGRTDAGVHAIAQVAHLEVNTQLPTRIIKFQLNDQLPSAINILHVEKVDTRFHARHDAVARSYVYQIATRRTAFGKNNCWWIKDKLNIAAMYEAAEVLHGFNDYASFGSSEDEDASTKVDIHWVRIYEVESSIIIHIVGSHFLWKMVRRMVGVLVEVGRGNLVIDQVKGMLTTYSSIPAKLTAPPSGLYLERVYYPDDIIAEDPIWILNLFNFL